MAEPGDELDGEDECMLLVVVVMLVTVLVLVLVLPGVAGRGGEVTGLRVLVLWWLWIVTKD